MPATGNRQHPTGTTVAAPRPDPQGRWRQQPKLPPAGTRLRVWHCGFPRANTQRTFRRRTARHDAASFTEKKRKIGGITSSTRQEPGRTGCPGRNGARRGTTPIVPTPGPPPPWGMQKVLWRLRWHTSAPM